MVTSRQGAAFGPAVVLAAAAGAAALSGVAAPAAPSLLVLAIGCALGAAVAILIVRLDAQALANATSAIAERTAGELPNRLRRGVLAPAARQVDSLAHALHEAQEAATTDRLTRVANRQTLLARLFEEVERVARYGRSLSIAFIDLDHFKQINDTFGHEVGDDVLRGVADVFREHTRRQDVVGRYGGEEFVVVMPETTVDEATAVAEKLRLQVLRQRFGTASAGEVAVSISIGVAGGTGGHLRVDQLLRDADAAMYTAKSLGRNQTYVFAEIDEDSARIPRAPISHEGRERAAEVGELGRQAAEAALAAVISPLPHYRGKPSALIAAIAVGMARELGLPDQEVERIRIASLLHDLGKVAVPEQILEKPGPLSTDEWQSVVQHPRIGQVIIDKVATVKDAGSIILHHHERYSGHGYPYGLRGSDIPLGARIVAIADAYDAMISDRPYRAAIGHQAAIEELRRYATIQFDPELVTLFCDLFAAAPPRPDPSLLITPPAPLGRVLEPSALERRDATA